MQNIYKYYNNTVSANSIKNISLSDKDCFLFKKQGATKTIFEEFFFPEETSSNYINVDPDLRENFRRFVKIPIAYDSNYPKSIEKAVNYKILKFKAADVTTRILINSFFTVWLRPQVYILKCYSLITNSFRIIYTRFLSTQLKIISVNLIISLFTGAIVILLTYRVSKSIGDPISSLISIVKNINPQKDLIIKNENKNNRNNNKDSTKEEKKAEKVENQDENGEEENHKNENNENMQMKSEASVVNNTEISNAEKLEKIEFPDDETINKFFQICKKLIKGGLADENLKVKQMQYNDEAFNNISFMKSNNLIVQEDKILKETESRSDKIFSHKSLLEKIKDFGDEKANVAIGNNNNNNSSNSKNQDFLTQSSIVSDNQNNLNPNNKNFSIMNSNKVYNPNSNGNNMIINSKNDDIKEIKLERQMTIEKPIKNNLASISYKNSFIGDSLQKSNTFIGGGFDSAKSKNEIVDLYPKFKAKKAEVEMYFQNTKNVNMTNLSYDKINFMMHSNVDRKKTDNYEKNFFNEESEFDRIVKEHFNKDSLDYVFELLKLFSN